MLIIPAAFFPCWPELITLVPVAWLGILIAEDIHFKVNDYVNNRNPVELRARILIKPVKPTDAYLELFNIAEEGDIHDLKYDLVLRKPVKIDEAFTILDLRIVKMAPRNEYLLFACI